MIPKMIMLWLLSVGTATIQKNLRVVFGANVMAQIIMVLSAPLIARLFGPSDFGVLALYLSLTTVLGSISTFRFDWLVPNVTKDRLAGALLILGFLSLIAFVTMLTLLILVLGSSILPDSYEALGPFLFFIPVGLLGLGVHQLFQGWFIRTADLSVVSKVKILQSFGNVVASLLTGFFSLGAFGLLLANVTANWLGLTFLISRASKLFSICRKIKISHLSECLKQFRRQAFLSVVVSGLNASSSGAMIILLALFYEPQNIGLLAFAHRLLAMPVTFISKALSQSFWAHAAELAREKEFEKLRVDYLQVSALMTVFAVLLSVGIVAVQPLVVILFGPAWENLGLVMLALMPLIWGSTIVSSTNHLIVLGQQGLQVYADISRLILVTFSVICAYYFSWAFEVAVFTVACSSLLAHGMLFFIHWSQHKKLVSIS